MNLKYMDFSVLSNKKLLELTLRETNDSKVVDELFEQYASLRELTSATQSELIAIKGIGPAKAISLLAFIELAKRISTYEQKRPDIIRGAEDVASLVMAEMRYLDREYFRTVLLNTKNHVLRIDTISIGTLNASMVHPRELFKVAIRNSAAAVILLHNHPSGDPTPSREDIQLTQRLVEAGELLGITVLDHIIIGDGIFISLKAKGLM